MIATLLASLLLSASPAPAPAVTAASTSAAVAPASTTPLVQNGRGGGGGNAAASGNSANQEGAVPPIQAEGDFFILNFAEKEDDEGMSLLEFIKACEQATGLQFIVPKEASDELKNETVRMIGTKRIPKQDFYSFFQIIMFIHNFACVEVGAPPLTVTVIQSLASSNARTQGSIRQKSIYVLPEELDGYADQPATLITTVVTLPHTDVRQLSNSLRSLITDQNTLNMVPAGNSDSLILQGFGSYIVQLAKLLFLIDQESIIPPPDPPVFDYVPLEFASADDVSDMVEQLLEASQEAEQVARQAAGETTTPQARNQSSAKIIVDRRTNSLAVVALPKDLPAIKELIARLDTEVIEPERSYNVYTLANVGAEELADVLESFLEDAARVTDSANRSSGSSQQGGSSGSSSTEEVVVVPEPATNSLLIAANKTRYAEVVQLIQDLDRRADQVLIETALIELSGNDFQDIGVELGFADLPGTSETGGFGITSWGLSTLEDLDLDGIPDARVPTFASGITAGILDGDDFALPFLVRLLQTRENANVLSVPSILVNNNDSATVSTLDERPFTQITATGGVSGQTQENFQGYQEAGITLTISPSISASRYLRLGVELEVSNFLGSTTNASIPPPRVTRRLQTTINVPDGDTMIIGGVITNNTTLLRQQTPWLGDLPIIGALFRRDQETEDRRTLYFFVTPHILADEDFADLAEISYRKKLEASDIIGADRLRVIDPDFGIGDDENTLMGFEVPLYRRPPVGEVDPADVGIDAQRRREMLDGASEKAAAKQAAAQDAVYGINMVPETPETTASGATPELVPAATSGGDDQ
ncbi:secretin N-terminal domain-containing protein [Engelhardtia mirabilis]|uniref:Type II secretion system protein D n=1 Tax=Engelhardtia mirabilis TaxID=2528011 RepID=A0A518BJP7_9BACT|nr:Putative type II secretion system protein D precursor [Planctomycetes bacterium Pla133]QDV01523.1 Putative type II secretion system protein D precursor [Planctomycetes bacterium Pla86]